MQISYMSGPKADAILARENDPTLKKKRKKPKNEDYIGGAASKDEGGGLRMKDEDEWKLKGGEEVDLDGADAPGKLRILQARGVIVS
jgi:pre-mRNA-splicing factor CWC26